MMLAADYWWIWTIVKVVVVLAIVPTGALVIGFVFLFKVMSYMQSRLGPMEAGPQGTLQLLADGLKFLQKEDITPKQADKWVFALAPVMVLASTFLVFVVLPAGPDLIVEDIQTGAFYALAVSSLSVIGILMAGWASANKFALLGGLRAAAQLIAYELPLLLAVLGVVIMAGTMSMQEIVSIQNTGEIFGWGGIGNPFIITQIVGFVIFMIAAQAELTQPPFDMPVAESELVTGYMVEYTGFRFLFFFIGEFGTAFAFAGLAATLWLGGWAVPWITTDAWWVNLVGVAVLFIKIMAISFLIFWVRFTYPRFREDQLQAIAWKYLIPIALVNVLATGAFKVWM